MGLFKRKPKFVWPAVYFYVTKSGLLHHSRDADGGTVEMCCGRRLDNYTLVAHYPENNTFRSRRDSERPAWVHENVPGHTLCKQCFFL